MTRHFIIDTDLSPDEQSQVLDLAAEMKQAPYKYKPFECPETVAVFFDKTSTRTRISFATGIADLGGNPLIIGAGESQLGHKESVEDTTRVLDRMVAMVVWRTFAQENLEKMAGISRVPIINALSDSYHPCQILADLQTIREYKGKTQGRVLAYLGDGSNNMAHSYLLGAATAGMEVRIAAPQDKFPNPRVVDLAKQRAEQTSGSVIVTDRVDDAVKDADVLATDTWVSMGSEDNMDDIKAEYRPYSITNEVVEKAKKDAIVLHCLPAYRGYEIDADVIDRSPEQGGHSVVWDEAENRLHAQKALMQWLKSNS